MATIACLVVGWHDFGMTLPTHFDQLSADELRRLLVEKDKELAWRQTKIDRLTHELAYYKRKQYGVKAEHLPVEQAQLFEETVAADLAAMTQELEQLATPTQSRGQAKRKPLPPELPRTDIHHEPDSTRCTCGCQMQRMGEDVAENLDTPQAYSPWNAISAASGSAANVKPWCRHQCLHM